MSATIHAVHIRNFQSLHDVSLELHPFTVIVGPSSSGKSAFTRALRTLVSNRRGTEWITHGQRTASITAKLNHGSVTLTRSRTTASSENNYVITPDDDPTNQQTYAKLGGDTPEDVSRFLGIPSGSTSSPPIQFAGQFDKPFLLDDSAAEVARTLGALTNVNVIFEAARESNRRKLSNAQTLRTRSDDLQAVKERLPEFKSLRQQDEALQHAESLIEKARQLQRTLTRLATLQQTIEANEPLIERLTPLAAIEVPDETPILTASSRLQSFQRTLTRVPTLAKAVQAAQSEYAGIEATEEQLLAEYAELVGTTTADLAKWFHGWVDRIRTTEIAGVTFVELDHAVEVFVKYLETKAGA